MNQEIAWLKASLRGDTAAFERIVAQYQSLVCSITLGATGRLEASEELAQETFLRAWKSLGQLKELDKFRSWLCTIARNCVQNYLRDQKRHAAVIADSAELAELTPSDSESIPDNLIRQEEEAMMQQALMRIPQDYRDVLILFYRQQQSVQKVAELLELTESNVRTRLHRGRELLREELASRIEKTLERTAPGKQFTKAVMVAIGSLVVGTAATSQAATASSTAGATGTSTLLTGIGVKIAAAAAAIIIGAGAWIYYAGQPDKTEALKPAILDSRRGENEATKTKNKTEGITKTAGTEDITAPIVNQKADSKTLVANPKQQSRPVVPKKITEPNVPYEFKPRGVLSGLITDIETGRPVALARVNISLGRYYMTKTDPNGFYYFDKIDDNGNYHLGIISDDYVGITSYSKQPVINLQKDKQVVQHFQLQKACKLEVLVVDPNGRPIQGADVRATVLSSDRKDEIDSGPMMPKRTGKDGKIIKGGFPPNDNYLITVTHNGPEVEVEGKPGYTQSFWDYAPAGLNVYLDKPGETENAEIVLEKGQSIRGIAKYKDGQPADDVKISAYPNWWHSNYCHESAEVEPNGLFTLEQIVPGTYQIQVSISTGEGSSMAYGLFSCALPLENDQPLQVIVPFNSPQSLTDIRGSVKCLGDQKPSYVEINAVSQDGEFHQGRIGDGRGGNVSGEFVIDKLEPGPYTVRFSGIEIEEKTIENVTAPAEGLEVELVYIGKPKLSGVVVDAQTGKPLGRFQIRFKKLQTLRGSQYLNDDRLTAFANDEGKFEVESVGPGIYQIQAQAAGYAPAWSDRVNTDQNAPVTIALTAGGATIKGIVLNENGRPVKDARVVPLSLANGTGPTDQDTFVSDKGAVVTNDQGEFILTCLAAGSETLKVTHPEYTFTIVKDIPAVFGQDMDNIRVVLRASGIVEGFIYDAEGNPQEGEVIYAHDKTAYNAGGDTEVSRLGTATSDPNGFYRMKGLPEGVCYLRRQNEWSAQAVVRRTIFTRAGKTMRVDFGGAVSLKGQIILADKPLVNQRVLLASEGNPYYGNFRAYSSTDSDGRFVFRGLVAGRLAVYYEQMGRRRDWIKLIPVQSVGEDMDLGIIPGKTSTVHLQLQQPVDNAWKIKNVNLVKDKSINEFIAATAPQNPAEPYVISQVQTGKYKLQAYREDNLIFSQEIIVLENQEQMDVTVELPAGTARLYGALSEKVTYVLLWSEDKKIKKSIIRSGDGMYEVDNLPSGKYYLGIGLTQEEDNSLSFYLGDGQQLMKNLDENSFGNFSLSVLTIQTVSTDGRLIEGAQMRLESDGRTLEPYAQSGSDTIFMTRSGQYTLQVHCDGYRDVQQIVSLEHLKTSQIDNPKKEKMTVFLEPLNPMKQ